MRGILLALLVLGLMFPVTLAAGTNDRDQRQKNQLINSKPIVLTQQSPSAGEGSGFTVVFSPEFYYGRHRTLNTTLNNTDFTQSSGTSQGVGFTFLVSKELTDLFTLSFIYQFAYNEYKGGNLTPQGLPLVGSTKQHAYSNMAGFIGAINLGRYGKIEPSILQGWDSYQGQVITFNTATNTAISAPPSVDNDFATSLMVWYSIDLPISNQLILTPYAGWRSVYVVLNNEGTYNTHAWAHLVSGGLTLKYLSGPLVFSLRAGVNYRVSKDDIPGLSTRAVAPSITHMGWMSSFDRTIGTFGVGLDYVISPNFILNVSYDGFAGRDTTFHKGGLSLVFPF
jgi:hypothetical protein